MVGTFGGALEPRHIDASGGRLIADVTGEVETEEGVLVIRRRIVTLMRWRTSARRRSRSRGICDAMSSLSHAASRDLPFVHGGTGLSMTPPRASALSHSVVVSRCASRARRAIGCPAKCDYALLSEKPVRSATPSS